MLNSFFNDNHSIRNSTTVLPNGNIKWSMSTFWRIFLKVILHLEVATLISWPVLYFCFQSIASCFPRDIDPSVLYPSKLLKLSLCKPLPFHLEWTHLSSISKMSSHSPFPHGIVPFPSLLCPRIWWKIVPQVLLSYLPHSITF